MPHRKHSYSIHTKLPLGWSPGPRSRCLCTVGSGSCRMLSTLGRHRLNSLPCCRGFDCSISDCKECMKMWSCRRIGKRSWHQNYVYQNCTLCCRKWQGCCRKLFCLEYSFWKSKLNIKFMIISCIYTLFNTLEIIPSIPLCIDS